VRGPHAGSAVDCGVAVNPDVVRAQMQGRIGFGLGHALFGGVTIDAGRPLQGNFDTYRSLRIDKMPVIEVVIVPSSEKPTGVGEPGVPPIGPAVADAMARLGLVRLRRRLWCEGTDDVCASHQGLPCTREASTRADAMR
jgi:isoquinoline 1-oxidoreductase subunit beta